LAVLIMKRIYTVMFAVSVSLALVAGGLLATYGLPLGIDFKGGSVLSVTFTGERPSVSQVREAITTSLGDVQSLTEVQLAPAGETGMILRSGPLDEDEHRALLEVLDESSGAPVVEESFESVGPAIGAELKSASIRAIIILIVVIVIYIAIVFRSMSRILSPWVMGLAALVALSHDIIVPMGLFALLGQTHGIQVTAVFVAAVLTVLGYSLSDTVVVFDRVRENILRGTKDSFGQVVHRSVMQTLVRSLNTTLTTLAALVAIWLFGGESLRHFSLALIVGITLGSYSSIFVAAPLLVWFSRRHRRASS